MPVSESYLNIDELVAAVADSRGVLTVEASKIRDAYGAERLGSQVRANISRELRGRGLGHFPVELPDRQNEDVRLYQVNSEVGALIEAALTPGQAYDQKLRNAGGARAELILDKVRELVCG